jgi:SnoaL-like domain
LTKWLDDCFGAKREKPPVPARGPMSDFERRLERLESQLAIQQLPIRYAMAIDGRDVEAWVKLFVPTVRVTKQTSGREALAAQIDGMIRTFTRSVHQICGHRIEFDEANRDHATGAVYCRAEHEVDDRWIVMAICYFDDYDRVEGEWLFRRRREKHWYAADVNEHPQAVAFDSWHVGEVPALPGDFPTWAPFWDSD